MIEKIKTVDEILEEKGHFLVNSRIEEVVNKVNEIIEVLNSVETSHRIEGKPDIKK